MPTSLQDQLHKILDEIESAKNLSGNPQRIKLIAVSKTFPAQAVKEAYKAGQVIFGENKVQEGAQKISLLDTLPLEWHLIGHLQTNKASKAVELFHTIHSVDSFKLAEKISSRACSLDKIQNILFQINTSLEDSKSGLPPEYPVVRDIIGQAQELPGLNIQGLMTIGPLTSDEKSLRRSFSQLRTLRDQLQDAFPNLKLTELSMGMSGDFKLAIQEGATMVRIGSLIFGNRTYL